MKWPTMDASVPLGAMERAAYLALFAFPIAITTTTSTSPTRTSDYRISGTGFETMAALMQLE